MATPSTNTSEECIELKNIKYKTMLLNGTPVKETKSSSDLTNLEKFLEDDKINIQNEPWSKLDKTIKTKKMMTYAEEYVKKNNLTSDEESALRAFLRDCLDRKRLQRVKDVEYDKTTGEVKDIPSLIFNKTTSHFTLKNLDKQRVSTLKSLPPKKAKGTIKNTKANDESESDNDN
ncbi:MAG: hypothetical protein EBY20_00625 [Alphaproteobacteria bacterium]|jgi:hypothetical protein|uniref:Uncharacterized protein n=1 Tax=viral metagenome TaxID=1070528 RepID=A0A6C0HQ23_9ZZZZ|nr:hypothetical protein [Alphaproteobacteria bacterium]